MVLLQADLLANLVISMEIVLLMSSLVLLGTELVMLYSEIKLFIATT